MNTSKLPLMIIAVLSLLLCLCNSEDNSPANSSSITVTMTDTIWDTAVITDTIAIDTFYTVDSLYLVDTISAPDKSDVYVACHQFITDTYIELYFLKYDLAQVWHQGNNIYKISGKYAITDDEPDREHRYTYTMYLKYNGGNPQSINNWERISTENARYCSFLYECIQ